MAQEFLLGICNSSGLDESQVLSCDAATPLSFEQVFAAATVTTSWSSVMPDLVTLLKAVHLVDDEFKRRHALCNTFKDVDDQLSATCVGVQLEDGVHLGVPPSRCLAMLSLCFFCYSGRKLRRNRFTSSLGAAMV